MLRIRERTFFRNTELNPQWAKKFHDGAIQARYCRDLLRPCPEDHTRHSLQDVFSELLKGLSQNLAFDLFGLGFVQCGRQDSRCGAAGWRKGAASAIPVCEGSLGLVIGHCQAVPGGRNSSHHNFGEVVGNSPELGQVLRRVEIAAASDATVLVFGETGTGKELIARALHRLSARRDGNFIKLDCVAMPTELLESELFWTRKGCIHRGPSASGSEG